MYILKSPLRSCSSQPCLRPSKIAVVTDDLGGKGTALGIKGAVILSAGPNYLTEIDATVFWSKKITANDDIGYTEDGNDNNQLSRLSCCYGSLPPSATIAPSTKLTTLSPLTVPPNRSISRQLRNRQMVNCLVCDCNRPSAWNAWQHCCSHQASLSRTYACEKLDEYFEQPAGTSCTDAINSESGLYLVKISNNNAAGLFASVFAVQMSDSTTPRVKRSTNFAG